MPAFTLEKSDKNKAAKANDYWLVDDSRDWAYIGEPLATKIGIKPHTPIRLKHGNERTFGARHIVKRQRANSVKTLVEKFTPKKDHGKIAATQTYAQEYLWLKLGHGGTVYSDLDNVDKSVFTLRTNPNSLLILEKQYCRLDNIEYLSVTSLYEVGRTGSKHLDGDKLGTYVSTSRADKFQKH